MDRPIDYGRYAVGESGNFWTLEPALEREARRIYAEAEYAWAEDVLSAFGETVATRIAPNADTVDDHGPVLDTYDRDGNLANAVDYHPAHLANERLAVEAGLVADAFSAPPGRDEPLGLTHPLVMQTLACYADVGLVCALSMTAGAALILENHDDAGQYDDLLEGLTTRDHGFAQQGAMFLTERQAGSDVGAVETVARPVSSPSDDIQGDVPESCVFELTGEKWFCSNIDAQVTLVLARRPHAPGGTEGLSLFWVPHELPNGRLNDQVYRRLKDKLGTESVATGEVEFDGTIGYLVGEPERGFAHMTTMLNWERATNAVGAAGVMGRALLESKIHAANRRAFGHPIDEFPLMRRDLVEMQTNFEAALAVSFEAARWLDRDERTGEDHEAAALVRTLVPVAKYRTARMAVETTSNAIEILGGDGYVAEFVTERLLRDAQVLPIWEGTSNVLSLELLRALERTDAAEIILSLVDGALEMVEDPVLERAISSVRRARDDLADGFATFDRGSDVDAQHDAKILADLVFDVVAASRLLEGAQRRLDRDGDARLAAVADRFVRVTVDNNGGREVGTTGALTDRIVDAILRYDRLSPDAIAE